MLSRQQSAVEQCTSVSAHSAALRSTGAPRCSCVLTHSPTHITHSLTPTHSPAPSLTRSLIHSFTLSHTHSLTLSLSLSLTHSLSLTPSLTRCSGAQRTVHNNHADEVRYNSRHGIQVRRRETALLVLVLELVLVLVLVLKLHAPFR